MCKVVLWPTGNLNFVDPHRRKIWMDRIGKHDVTTNTRICVLHFSDANFENKRIDGKRKLKPNAVPDLLRKESCPCISPYTAPDILHVKTEPEILDVSSNEIYTELVKTENTSQPDEPQQNVSFSDADAIVKDECEMTLVKNEPAETHTEVVTCAHSLQQQQQVIESLRVCLNKALRERNHFKSEVDRMEMNLKRCFNDDQIYYMKHGNSRGHLWSDATMDDAVKLYNLCGGKGYEEIRRQGLPFPGVRTVQVHQKNSVAKIT